MKVFLQDPDEVLRYKWDWTAWLTAEAETISTSDFLPVTGLTLASPTNDTLTATVKISGGTAGDEYTVTNRIVTSGGQTKDQSATFRMRQR